MDILINVSGKVYSLPLTGEKVYLDTIGVPIWCVGFLSGSSGISRSTLIDAKYTRILSCVPVAPSFTTVASITAQLPDVSRYTVRRLLLDLRAQGIVTSTRPKKQGRGTESIRWMRI